MTTEELLSVTQVAEELEVDRSKIFRLIKKDKLKTLRAGWVHLISRGDLPDIRDQLGLTKSNNSSSSE